MKNELSRRRFLEDSMLAATAALSAGSASRLLADDDQGSKSPNERISVAVIGVRGRGISHLNAFAGRKDTEVTYVCDVDEGVGEGRGKEVANKQDRAPRVVKDMRRVFDDKSVDIVTTATPNHWHALCSIWALQAGKDVYVEKPVSHNVSEGRRIVEAARKYDKICQTGTQSRSNTAIQQAIQFIQEGGIGDCNLARALCYKRRKTIGAAGKYQPPAKVDYDLWLGPAPTADVTRKQFHYDWHWFWDYGNGDLGNQGIHQMDIARWGLGVNDLGVGVLSYGGRLGYEDAGETANTQVSIHDYGDKRLVFEVRGLETDDLRGAKIGNIFYGSEGYVVINGSKAALFDPEGQLLRDFEGQEEDHFYNFLSAVKSRRQDDLNADILQGHLSSTLCHLGNISYRLGNEQAHSELKQALGRDAEAQVTLTRFSQHLADNGVDLAKASIRLGAQLAIDSPTETFTNNEQANGMLSREYRAPFVVPAAGQV